VNNLLNELRNRLRAVSDEKVRESGLRFFREPVTMYGIKSADVTGIAKEYRKKTGGMEKKEILEMCEDLWKSGYMEESFVASEWAYSLRKEYKTSDFRIFEGWVNHYVSNWASCDTLCNHTIGSFIEMYPEYLSELKKWARSPNRWTKRASAVSLIIPARKGLFIEDIFEIADILHSDPDDMVQKGYGWMLKAASQAYCERVFDYVMLRKGTMPRTSLRYAIEKMPADMKKQAMAR
jgi:3-methyladenine DNA glycosylase AlkD